MAKILIIDDDENILNLFRNIFETDHHEVYEATDGNVGMEIVKELKPDLVITDIIMPEKDGTEVILQLKKEAPNTKIIALSGGGMIGPKNYLKVAEKIGADLTFYKPFDLQQILDSVRKLLAE